MRYADSIDSTTQPPVKGNMWMRRIEIEFSSKNDLRGDLIETDDQSFIEALREKYPGLRDYGKNGGIRLTLNDEYNIRVQGSKHLAINQDNGVIVISNVSYETIALITVLQLYRVSVRVGYADCDSLFTVATGEVSWIQQKIRTSHDYELYITYASELVAAFSQYRINFSVYSGINVYDMFKYMFLQQGVSPNRTKFSERLKNIVAKNIVAMSGTTADVISGVMDEYALQTNGLLVSTDGSLDNTIINVTELGDKDAIVIPTNYIYLAGGNPTVTSDGLAISFFPMCNFKPGDVIKIENRIIDTSQGMTSGESVSTTFNTNYLNPDGLYILHKVNYTFENRGDTFIFECQARPINQLSGLGVSG